MLNHDKFEKRKQVNDFIPSKCVLTMQRVVFCFVGGGKYMV